MKCGAVCYLGYYFIKIESTHEFRDKLDSLEDVLQNTEGSKVVAGDFNERLSSGMSLAQLPREDSLNVGNVTTFRLPGSIETAPSFASKPLAPLLQNSRIT